jgi:PTS system galactitol-specific IIA component
MMSNQPSQDSAHLFCDPSLVVFFESQVTQEDVIQALSQRLFAGGFVHPSYANAVLEREKVFPTGLPTQPLGIAIPHTDPEHVKAGAIAVGILTDPVLFREMGGTDEQWVDAFIVMALAIDEPSSVSTILRSLALAFQDSNFLMSLKESQDAEEVLQLLGGRFPGMVTGGDAVSSKDG